MTNVAYVNSMPHERNYDLFYIERLQQGDPDDEDFEEGEDDDDGDEGVAAAAVQEPGIMPEILTKTTRRDFR